MFLRTIRSLTRPGRPRTIASAIRAARTFGRTSWTRTMSTPAATPSAVVARVASRRWSAGRSSTLPSVDLRDVPEEDRPAQDAQRGEVAEQREVVLGRLPEPEARVDDDRSQRNARRRPRGRSPLEIREDLGDEVLVARLRPVVHEDDRGAALGRERDQRVVLAHAPDVVEQIGARVERRCGDGRLRRVDAERRVGQRRAERGDRRGRPAPLSSAAERPRGPDAWIRRRRRAGRRPRRPSRGPGRPPLRPGRPVRRGGRRRRRSRA